MEGQEAVFADPGAVEILYDRHDDGVVWKRKRREKQGEKKEKRKGREQRETERKRRGSEGQEKKERKKNLQEKMIKAITMRIQGVLWNLAVGELQPSQHEQQQQR
jgi:hypothetical protein